MIEIFSGPQCGFCKRAKALLEARGLSYVDRDVTDEACRAEMAQRLPRSRSIPQIFINGEHVGGFEDLEILDQKGGLTRLA